LKNGDKVQIRRFDVTDHWLFAVVQDATSRRVQIAHPGNSEDGKVLLVAAADIRTKADVLSLMTSAQAVAGGRLSDAHLKSLGAQDGWILQFLQPYATAAREKLNAQIVDHYQNIANALS
jgi:hypothetical protein